jgi:hypothetical protein
VRVRADQVQQPAPGPGLVVVLVAGLVVVRVVMAVTAVVAVVRCSGFAHGIHPALLTAFPHTGK